MDAEKSEIIDRIYDVAVDPLRYEEMLTVWERSLSQLRKRAFEDDREQVELDGDIASHVSRAEVFLQRLYGSRDDAEAAPIGAEVRAAFSADARGRVLQVNATAEEALGLRVGKGLAGLPLAPEDRRLLEGAIRKVALGEAKAFKVLSFPSTRSRRPIVFHVAAWRPEEPKVAAALVRTTEVGWPSALSQVLREAFGLTPSEIDVVRGLAEGGSLKDVAVSRGRSIETIKTHLSGALAKSGARNQAELLRMTLGLMDVIGAEPARVAAGTCSEHLDPLPFQSLRLPDGRRYEWIEFGDPEGRPCLYLPIDYGFLRWPRAAEKEAQARGLRVIAPVRAGYGGSDPMPKRVRSYAEATGADLLALLDHLSLSKVAILCLGADFRFAVALAVKAPKRVAGILGCSAALPVMTAEQYERMGKWHRFILANARYTPKILPFLVKAGFALARRLGKESFFRAVHDGSPADMRVFSDPTIREAILLGSDICLSKTHSAHEAFARECIDSESSWEPLLRACTVPIRLLQGGEDLQTPAATVRELAAEFPKLDVTIVEEAGTLLFFQMWREVLDELAPMLETVAGGQRTGR